MRRWPVSAGRVRWPGLDCGSGRGLSGSLGSLSLALLEFLCDARALWEREGGPAAAPLPALGSALPSGGSVLCALCSCDFCKAHQELLALELLFASLLLLHKLVNTCEFPDCYLTLCLKRALQGACVVPF